LAKGLFRPGLGLDFFARVLLGSLRQQINAATLPEDIPTEYIRNVPG
jgi:hypothetical protein